MKKRLLQHCIQLAERKAQALEQELRSAQDSTKQESKSSAGDKHETGRAMMHLEQEKLYKQLAEAHAVVAELQRIDPDIVSDKVGLGSIVNTDKNQFFIAVGLGRIEFEGSTCFVVSNHAPIAALFIGKSKSHTVKFNNTEYDILSVE